MDRTRTSSGEPRSRRRDATYDIARAAAITGIVLGHVVRGLAAAGMVDPDDPLVRTLDRGLYLAHLPVFAVVSGLLLRAGVERDGPLRAVLARATDLLWLYVVWRTVNLVVQLAAGDSVNATVHVGSLLDLARPGGPMWFLPWLAITSGIVAVVRPWAGPVRCWGAIVASGLVAVVAWGTDPGIVGLQGGGLAVFFVVAAAVSRQTLDGWTAAAGLGARRSTALGVLALGVFVALVCTTPVEPPTAAVVVPVPLPVVLLSACASAAAVVDVLLLARAVAIGRAADSVSVRLIAGLGRRTLDVYVLSSIAGSGTRIALRQIGVDAVVVHVLLGTMVGVLGAYAAGLLARRLRLEWLFVAPWAGSLRSGAVGLRTPTAVLSRT